MNTLAPHPQPEAPRFHPDNVANEQAPAQDPWAGAAEHSGDLSPLPHMTPAEEAQRFEVIAHDLENLPPAVDPWSEQVNNPTHSAAQNENVPQPDYSPRHLRLNDEPFTPTPISDVQRRNEANLKATLAVRHTLRDTEPQQLADAEKAIHGERPANYKGRHRLLGRFARFFSR